MRRHNDLSKHPLAGGIAFIVQRAIGIGVPVRVKHHAERMLKATPHGKISLAGLEAEIRRVALCRGALLEPA